MRKLVNRPIIFNDGVTVTSWINRFLCSKAVDDLVDRPSVNILYNRQMVYEPFQNNNNMDIIKCYQSCELLYKTVLTKRLYANVTFAAVTNTKVS